MKSSGYCSWEATTLVCNDHVSVTILLTFARICLRDNISRLIGTEPAVEGIVGIVEGAGDDTSELLEIIAFRRFISLYLIIVMH